MHFVQTIFDFPNYLGWSANMKVKRLYDVSSR